MSEATFGEAPVCHGHADVPTIPMCGGCARPTCDTCAFITGGSRYCFDCMSAGSVGGQGALSPFYAAGSIVCGMLGAVALSMAMFQLAGKQYAGVLGIALVVFPIGGLALGLISRDNSRRTGSPMPLIGIIANSLLVAIFIGLWILSKTRN